MNVRQTEMLKAILLILQLNGSMVGDVHIKVSIARKQPMLDAATGKSVWASLGKRRVLALINIALK